MSDTWHHAIALDQLNHVAEALSKKLERRLVLIFNNVHYFQHTSQGRNVLLQLQQRAEFWAENGEHVKRSEGMQCL